MKNLLKIFAVSTLAITPITSIIACMGTNNEMPPGWNGFQKNYYINQYGDPEIEDNLFNFIAKEIKFDHSYKDNIYFRNLEHTSAPKDAIYGIGLEKDEENSTFKEFYYDYLRYENKDGTWERGFSVRDARTKLNIRINFNYFAQEFEKNPPINVGEKLTYKKFLDNAKELVTNKVQEDFDFLKDYSFTPSSENWITAADSLNRVYVNEGDFLLRNTDDIEFYYFKINRLDRDEDFINAEEEIYLRDIGKFDIANLFYNSESQMYLDIPFELLNFDLNNENQLIKVNLELFKILRMETSRIFDWNFKGDNLQWINLLDPIKPVENQDELILLYEESELGLKLTISEESDLLPFEGTYTFKVY